MYKGFMRIFTALLTYVLILIKRLLIFPLKSGNEK